MSHPVGYKQSKREGACPRQEKTWTEDDIRERSRQVKAQRGVALGGALVVGGVDHHRRAVMTVDVVVDAGKGLELAAGVVVQV